MPRTQQIFTKTRPRCADALFNISTCEYLDKLHGNSFIYIGIDLFGGDKKSQIDEIEPNFLKNQTFSKKKCIHSYKMQLMMQKKRRAVEDKSQSEWIKTK